MRDKPSHLVNDEIIVNWLTIANKSLEMTIEGDLSKRDINFAKDNIVSAIGKLLKTKSD